MYKFLIVEYNKEVSVFVSYIITSRYGLYRNFLERISSGVVVISDEQAHITFLSPQIMNTSRTPNQLFIIPAYV